MEIERGKEKKKKRTVKGEGAKEKAQEAKTEKKMSKGNKNEED